MEILNFRTLTDRDQRIALLGGGLAGLTSSRRSRLANRTTIILKYIDKASRFVQQTVEAICASGEIETGDSRVPLRARFIFIVSYLDKTGEFAPGLAKILNESPCLTIPPLRERSDEFVLILNELGVTLPDPELVSTINTYHWPGNITELKAYLRTLNGLSYDEALKQSERRELHRMILLVEEGKEFPLMEAVSRIIDGIVARALDRHSDQFSRAASMLGLSEREVRRIWKNSQRNLV